MKIIKFDELHKYDYNIDIVDFRLHYNTGATYNCTADGRPNNGILYYADIETIHTFPDKTHHFKKDDFVYFPMGAKFSSVFATGSEQPTEINGIHIAFLLKDASGEFFKLSDDVLNLSEKSNKNVSQLGTRLSETVGFTPILVTELYVMLPILVIDA